MEATPIQNTVRTLIDFLGVSVDSLEVRSGHRTVVSITSQDSKILIGPHGEHLQALTLLARKLVERAHGEDSSNFLIDVNNYHEDRLEKVRQNARILAQRARLFKHDVELEPMSSYERLVIHELFAEDPEIKTESAGEGKFRHIVLRYQSPTTSV